MVPFIKVRLISDGASSSAAGLTTTLHRPSTFEEFLSFVGAAAWKLLAKSTY